MVDAKKVVLVVVAIGAFLLMSASNGGNNWREHKWFSLGLWNSCDQSTCYSYRFDSVPDKLHATRAFTTIGTLLCAVGAIVALIRLCKDVDGKIVAGILIGAGLCMVIGLAIYTDYTSVEPSKLNGVSYGWSYILGWIASILAFVAGALHFFLK